MSSSGETGPIRDAVLLNAAAALAVYDAACGLGRGRPAGGLRPGGRGGRLRCGRRRARPAGSRRPQPAEPTQLRDRGRRRPPVRGGAQHLQRRPIGARPPALLAGQRVGQPRPRPQQRRPGRPSARRSRSQPGDEQQEAGVPIELRGGEGVAVPVHHQVEPRVAPHQVAAQAPVVEHLGARRAACRAPGPPSAARASGSSEVWGTATREGDQGDGTAASHDRADARATARAYDGRAAPAGARQRAAPASRHRPARFARSTPRTRRRATISRVSVQGFSRRRHSPTRVAASRTAKRGGRPRDPVRRQPLGEVRRDASPTATHRAVQGGADGRHGGRRGAGRGHGRGPQHDRTGRAVEGQADGRHAPRPSARPATSRAASPTARPAGTSHQRTRWSSSVRSQAATTTRGQQVADHLRAHRQPALHGEERDGRHRHRDQRLGAVARRGVQPRGRAAPRAARTARRHRPGRTSPRSWPSRSPTATGSAPSRRVANVLTLPGWRSDQPSQELVAEAEVEVGVGVGQRPRAC